MKEYIIVENDVEVEIEEYTLWEFICSGISRISPYIVKISYLLLYVLGFFFVACFCIAVAVVALDVLLIAGGSYAGSDACEIFFMCVDFILGTLKVAGVIAAVFGVSLACGFGLRAIALRMRKNKNRRCRKAAKVIARVSITLAWPALLVVEYLEKAQYEWGTLNLLDYVVGD